MEKEIVLNEKVIDEAAEKLVKEIRNSMKGENEVVISFIIFILYLIILILLFLTF